MISSAYLDGVHTMWFRLTMFQTNLAKNTLRNLFVVSTIVYTFGYDDDLFVRKWIEWDLSHSLEARQ